MKSYTMSYTFILYYMYMTMYNDVITFLHSWRLNKINKINKILCDSS